MREALRRQREEMVKAKHEYKKVERRWYKKAKTYFADKYSLWDHDSVVTRVRQRLQEADNELDAALTNYHVQRREYMAYRTYLALEKSQQDDTELTPCLLKSMSRLSRFQMASLDVALKGPSEVAKGRFERNDEGPGAVDLVARQLGLAQAWGLMYASEL